jgi:hypothetical protein
MIRAALPQLKHTPVGKRLETKINELDAEHETETGDYVAHSSSTSPTPSDVLSGNDTSLTEDTGIISSDAEIGLWSPDSRPRSTAGVSKTKIRVKREDERAEELFH